MTHSQMTKIIAIKEGCPCGYIKAVSVLERFKGKTVWEGIVFVFALNRPPIELCYGWVDLDTKSLVTVRNRYSVESPSTAVRAYIEARGGAQTPLR